MGLGFLLIAGAIAFDTFFQQSDAAWVTWVVVLLGGLGVGLGFSAFSSQVGSHQQTIHGGGVLIPTRYGKVIVERARRGAFVGLGFGALFALWAFLLMLVHRSVWIPRRAGGATHGGVAMVLYLTLMPLVGAVVAGFPRLFAHRLRAYVTGVVLGLVVGAAIGAVNMDVPVASWDGAISVVFFALTVGGFGGIVAHRSYRGVQ